jgi:GNAT superfamily N-acetyltransferase
MTEFTVRHATAADAPVLARHRAEMFREMNTLPTALYDALVAASRAYFERAIPDNRYLGWVGESAERRGRIVAGVGLQIRELAPRPEASGRLATGPEGYVLNVFTEQAWRHRGVAQRLMRELVAWADAHGIKRLTLHASSEARPLYGKLGFVPTNEMRRTSE